MSDQGPVRGAVRRRRLDEDRGDLDAQAQLPLIPPSCFYIRPVGVPSDCRRSHARKDIIAMSRIPFIEARFLDTAEIRYALEECFEQFLLDIRSDKLRPKVTLAEETDDLDDETLPGLNEDPVPILKLGGNDRAYINRRVAHLLERRKSASGLDHLKKEDRDRLEC